MQKESKSQTMYELVEQWQESGKSQKQFSEEKNIKIATFIYWVQKYRQDKASGHGFASLSLSPEPAAGSIVPKIEIALSGGIVVRIY